MKLHKNQPGTDVFQNSFHLQKGIVRGVIHAAAADEVDDRHVAQGRLKNAPAISRLLGRQIGRTQHTAVIL